MTPPAALPVEFTPVFDWRPPSRRKVSLFSFIAASAALHALCFYLFQIIYPPTAALSPPPARVNVITAQSEEGRVLLRWIEAEDPALSSTTQRPPDSPALALPRVNHVPSYSNWKPVLREVPPLQPDLRIPSAQPPAPVQLPSPPPPQAMPNTPSTLQFGSEVQSRVVFVLPLQFTASRAGSPQAAEFRIAIDAEGVVRHCFVQARSGDAALDEQASRAIVLCRFAPTARAAPDGPPPLLWTTATLNWGNDVAPPPALAPAASPAL